MMVALSVACVPKFQKSIDAKTISSGEVFESLPSGDMLMTLDLSALLNTTVPNMLKNSPDQKKEFEAGLKEMQDKTGIDPKQLKLMAISMNIPKSSGGKPEFAAVVTGTFDKDKLNEQLKKDKDGKDVPSEDYNGQKLFVKKDRDEVAVAVLDAGTMVIGMPASKAKAAIDAYGGKGDNATKDADLFGAFKESKSSATLRFAMKVPTEMAKQEMGPNSNNKLAQDMLKTKILFGSLDGASGIGLELIARTSSADEAKAIADGLNQMLDQAKEFVSKTDQLKGYSAVVNTLKATTSDKDAKIAIDIPTAILEQIAADIEKAKSGAMQPPSGDSGMDKPSMDDEEDDDEDSM